MGATRGPGLPDALDVHGGHSVIYELIEFVAVIAFGGDLGQAYLGTQCDVWDSQKDMGLALAGATLTLVLLAARGRLPVRK